MEFPFKFKEKFQRPVNPDTFVPRELPLKKIIQKEEKKGGQKTVFLVLVGSILAILGFWLYGKVQGQSLIEENSTQAQVEVNNKRETPTKIPENPVSNFQKLVSPLKGRYGLYVYNLSLKKGYGVLENEIFTAASINKLPVILALYQAVEKGKLNLSDKYVLKASDKRTGSGSLYQKPVGTKISYLELATQMGKQSDNTAFTIVRNVLGDDNIQKLINDLGMSHTNLEKSETSPGDVGLFFKKLYTGNLVTKQHRDDILDSLTKTIYETRIPAGIPEEVRVAHKVGSEVHVVSDAGIVFGEKPFILVILSDDVTDTEAEKALPQIAKLIWDFEK